MSHRINKSRLDNGVRILTKAMPHVRSVSMGVWVSVGARDESASESGLSHMIEHMIFKGTHKRSAYQIAKEFDAVGGHTNAFTSFESTCYHARVMDTHLAKMVDILTDIFLNSAFHEDEIAKERPVIFQEISMVEDNPEEFVHVLSGKAYWGDNPLGRSILGTRENILQYDSAAVKSFFRHFYQPEHIVISVAGNVDHDRFVDLVGPEFEKIKNGRHFEKRKTPVGNPQTRLHYRDIEQTHICLGTNGIAIRDPRRYAFSLLNTIFGGNMSSRLFQNIRERRGLAYSVYSFVSSFEDTGMFGAYAGVSPENTLETTRLLIEELKNLEKERVGADELNDAKNYTRGNLLLASESVDNQMVRLAQNEINFERQIPLQEALDKIDSVCEDDILGLADSLIKKDRLALTVLGPMTDETQFNNILTQ